MQINTEGMLSLDKFSEKYGGIKACSINGHNHVVSALVGKSRVYYRYDYQIGEYVEDTA